MGLTELCVCHRPNPCPLHSLEAIAAAQAALEPGVPAQQCLTLEDQRG